MVKQELENIKVQEEEEANAPSKAINKALLPPEGDELFDPAVDQSSLAIGFNFETPPVSQGN